MGDKVLHFEVRLIRRIYRRRYLLLDTALEFILTDGKSYLFVFDEKATRDEIHDLLSSSYPQFSEGSYSSVLSQCTFFLPAFIP